VSSVLREAGRQLGAVLSTVVNLLNPGAIVISGTIASAGDALFAGVREVVYSRSTSLATRDLKIVPSSLGARAGVMGSLYSVLEEIFSEASIAELLEKRSA
jgi:predicted NBD/HSP70 family sugar kinase